MTDKTTTPAPDSPPRRDFLGAVLGMTALVGAATPLIASLLRPAPNTLVDNSASEWTLLFDPATLEKRKAKRPHAVESFDLTLSRLEGWRVVESHHRVYVAQVKDGEPQYFTATCPHAGCIVELQDAKTAAPSFFCPCHQGRFDSSGNVTEGPPPRGLDSLETRVTAAGLEVRLQRFRLNIEQRVAL